MVVAPRSVSVLQFSAQNNLFPPIRQNPTFTAGWVPRPPRPSRLERALTGLLPKASDSQSGTAPLIRRGAITTRKRDSADYGLRTTPVSDYAMDWAAQAPVAAGTASAPEIEVSLDSPVSAWYVRIVQSGTARSSDRIHGIPS